MSMSHKDVADFRVQLALQGESTVRGNISAGRYGEEKEGHAENWLADQQDLAEAASAAADRKIARSAKNAAWAAAAAAILALPIAILALYVSYLALTN